jgi:stage III sporulation protein SpoIIIAA
MASWTIKRRGDDGPNAGLYDLRAALSYVNQNLFEHPEYAAKREIRVRLNKDVEYRIDGGSARLEGTTLTVEGVSLWRL